MAHTRPSLLVDVGSATPNTYYWAYPLRLRTPTTHRCYHRCNTRSRCSHPGVGPKQLAMNPVLVLAHAGTSPTNLAAAAAASAAVAAVSRRWILLLSCSQCYPGIPVTDLQQQNCCSIHTSSRCTRSSNKRQGELMLDNKTLQDG